MALDIETQRAHKRISSQKYRENNPGKVKEQQRIFRLKHRDRLRKEHKLWTLNNRDKRNKCDRNWSRSPRGRWISAQRQAKKREKEFSLTLEEYWEAISKPCYYCDNKFGKPVTAGMGLDRLNNNVGYCLGNIVSCCKNCNTVRSNLLTSEEMKAVIALILKIRDGGSSGT